jgi:hypothetical protein
MVESDDRLDSLYLNLFADRVNDIFELKMSLIGLT